MARIRGRHKVSGTAARPPARRFCCQQRRWAKGRHTARQPPQPTAGHQDPGERPRGRHQHRTRPDSLTDPHPPTGGPFPHGPHGTNRQSKGPPLPPSPGAGCSRQAERRAAGLFRPQAYRTALVATSRADRREHHRRRLQPTAAAAVPETSPSARGHFRFGISKSRDSAAATLPEMASGRRRRCGCAGEAFSLRLAPRAPSCGVENGLAFGLGPACFSKPV